MRYSKNFAGETETGNCLENQAPYYFRFEGRNHHAGEFQNYIDYFARCLDNGEVPKPDLEEGIETVATLSAMERSIKRGMPVKVSEVLGSV